MSFENLMVKTEPAEKCTSTGPYFNSSNTSPTENLVENNEKCTSTTPYFTPSTIPDTVEEAKEEPIDNEASAQWTSAQPGFTYIQDEYTSDFGIHSNASSQNDNFHLTSPEPTRYTYNNLNVNNAQQYQFCDLAYAAGGSSPATSGSVSNSSLSPDSHSLQNVPVYQQHHHIDKMTMSRKSITFCKVCGDKASGYHYGVTSCEGCKGFFRRSIQRKSDYRCLKMQACEIRRESRNRCQYCRFRKCIDSGMSKESVRQIKRNSKQSASVACSSDSEGHVSSSTSPEPSDHFKQIAQQVSQAHMEISPYTDLKVRNMVSKPYSVSVEVLEASQCSSELNNSQQQQTIANRLNAWQMFSVEVDLAIQNIVNFVKEIPKFNVISADQQASLLKKHSFAVYMLFIARGLSTKGLFLYDGRLVTFNDLRLLYGTLADDMLVFANKLLSLGLTDGDIAVFMTVILSQPTEEMTSQSGGKTQAEFIHEVYHRTLHLKLGTRANGVELYQTLVGMIDDLNILELNHFNQLKCLREHSQIINLPPLFIELYSIDKRVLTQYNHQQVVQPAQYQQQNYSQHAHHVQC